MRSSHFAFCASALKKRHILGLYNLFTYRGRNLVRKQFGDAGYVKEEIVAKLGATFLCADLGLKLEDCSDHAAYIGSSLKVLKRDSDAIFTAAAHAKQAVDYLHGLQAGEGSS